MIDGFNFSFEETNEQTTHLDEIPGGFGKFGWEKTNPIPIEGISNNKHYLSALRYNGLPIIYQRKGSTRSDNILDIIDHYEIFDIDHQLLGSLFLCPYHLKNSEKAPEDLTF